MLFHKPFKTKSNVLLRSSERKRIKGLILTQFPALTEEKLDKIYCKEIYSLKIETHSEEIVIVYMAYKLPLIFEYNSVIYPCVYLSWIEPDITPAFTTHADVLKFIRGGADLMLPGIILKNPHNKKHFGSHKKGDRVLINLSSNKAGVAVGETARSSEDLFMSGGKGKAVNILHYWGDELCKMAIEIDYPQLGKPDVCKTQEELDLELAVQLQAEEDQAQLSQALETQTLSDTVTGDDDGGGVGNGISYAQVANNVNSTDSPVHQESETPQEDENTPEFMDKLYEYSFIKAIKSSQKKIELPMLASNFNKVHMIPACPCGYSLDIKKSSHKKLSNFLTNMANTGIIRLETNAGVLKITSVQYNHDLIRRFVDHYENGNTGPNDNNANKKKEKKVEVIESYNVTAAVLPLFSQYLCKKGDPLPVKDIKKHIVDYVSKEKLQDETNKQLVHLNDLLKAVLLSKTTPEDIVISYEQLMKEVTSKMTQSYQVTMNSDQILSQYKGKMKPIDLQVATRSGNKKVTLISNLDVYGIDLKEFCKLCQHGVAASTCINMVNNAAQVQVQGNQIVFVNKLLTEKFGVQKRFIRGTELAPKKKR
uniref:Eukaryotic translation initiation factor 2D n=2 Tax=Cacopsylla melanoneura TaxID=428564 RepID=A0A8D8QZQ3_9HEMI